MTHFSEHHGGDPIFVRRLHEIPMTESERRAALLSLQRGERVAEFVFTAAQAARRFCSAVVCDLAAALRELTAWSANRRTNRSESKRRRAQPRRAGST